MGHIQVQVLGAAPDGEVWSCGLRFAKLSDPGPGPTDGGISGISTEVLQEITDGITELNSGVFITSQLRSMMSSSLSVVGLRANLITSEGALEAAAETTLTTPLAGVGSASRPLQTACAISLNMGARYGRSGRGRIFWPAIGGPPINSSNLRVTPAGRTAAVTDFNQMQRDWGGVINSLGLVAPAFRLCVYSRKLAKETLVENISVGDVLDTQRRRRDALRELRTQQARL